MNKNSNYENELSYDDVCVNFGTGTSTVEALSNIDLKVLKGEFVAILGPSGCGKSTLLRIGSGLMRATSGSIKLRDEPVNESKQLRRNIGVVFQKPNLLPWKTVRQNVMLPAKTLGLPIKKANERAIDLVGLVELEDFIDRYPYELSGGMQQRVGIARMLLHDPSLLFMDEPFAALDALTRENLMLELLRIWNTQKKSVVYITHSIQEAVFLADRIIVMSPRPGRIIENIDNPVGRPRGLATLDEKVFSETCQKLRKHFINKQVVHGE